MAYRRFPRPAAFTLVELLVVIGIIALLISILLPTLGAAKEQARTTQCASNMRQLAIALVNYAAENKGKFPPNINVLIPQPSDPAPTANLWYDLDRIGRYLPRGVIPRDISITRNPTIGGTVVRCPSDYDRVQRSYQMNIWASSMTDQGALNFSPVPRTYANGSYQRSTPSHGEFWGSGTKGSTQLILLIEGQARNSTAAGSYANATAGLITEAGGNKPGAKFLGVPGYEVGYTFDGPVYVYPNWKAKTQIGWFKHRSKNQRNRPAFDAVGRANFAFGDGHVELLAHDDVADTMTKLSKLRILWSPLDREINN